MSQLVDGWGTPINEPEDEREVEYRQRQREDREAYLRLSGARDTPTPVDPQRQERLWKEIAELVEREVLPFVSIRASARFIGDAVAEVVLAALQRTPALAVEIDDFLAGLLEHLPPRYRERAEQRLAAMGTPVLGERERELERALREIRDSWKAKEREAASARDWPLAGPMRRNLRVIDRALASSEPRELEEERDGYGRGHRSGHRAGGPAIADPEHYPPPMKMANEAERPVSSGEREESGWATRFAARAFGCAHDADQFARDGDGRWFCPVCRSLASPEPQESR